MCVHNPSERQEVSMFALVPAQCVGQLEATSKGGWYLPQQSFGGETPARKVIIMPA